MLLKLIDIWKFLGILNKQFIIETNYRIKKKILMQLFFKC